MSWQDESNTALWLATRVGKIAPSCLLGTTLGVPYEKLSQKAIIKTNPLFTKLVQSRWLGIGLVLLRVYGSWLLLLLCKFSVIELYYKHCMVWCVIEQCNNVKKKVLKCCYQNLTIILWLQCRCPGLSNKSTEASVWWHSWQGCSKR